MTNKNYPMEKLIESRVKFVSEKLSIDLKDVEKLLMNCTIDKSQSKNISDYIDHTILKSQTTKKQVQDLCKEAIEYKFPCVCVNGSKVKECVELISNSSIVVASVIGFPLGG